MGSSILVTGATGTVSTATLRALSSRSSVSIRAGVRPGALETDALALRGVTTVDFDFSKPDTYRAALDGVDALFLLTPFTEDQVTVGARFLAAVRGSGVRHIVKLSASVAESTQVGRWHRDLERAAASTEIPLTILRASFFFQNFIHYYAPQEDGAIYLPWGAGRASFIDVRDIGEIAARLLVDGPTSERSHRLTGPAAVGASEVAAAIGKVTQRAIRYVDVPDDVARSAMARLGMPGWMIDAMMGLNNAIKSGSETQVTSDVERLLGRRPRDLASFTSDHARAWAR